MGSTLEAAVDQWRAADAWEVRLVGRVGDGAVVVLFRRQGHSDSWLELVHRSSQRLERTRLQALGLRRKRWLDGPTAWGRAIDAEADVAAIVEAVRSALDEFREAGALSFEVLCQREAPPRNPDLLAAMRKAAQQQDDDTRRRLYAALVNATLLVPIDPATEQLPPAERRPLSVAVDAAGSVFGAFSDWDALRQWQPMGHAFGPVHGIDFFVHAQEEGTGGVRINPDGFVGGELYPAEVKMMVEAVRQHYRRTMS